MAKQYTSVFDVYNDTTEYMSLRMGNPLTLGNIQQLAVNRFTYIVNNYSVIKQNLSQIAKGDSVLLSTLSQLTNVVSAYNLGNTKYNPFASQSDFIFYNPILTLININSLQLTQAETTFVNQEMQRVSKLGIPDFQEAVAYLDKQYTLRAQQIGLGDADGDALFGVGEMSPQREATIQDLDNLQQLIDLKHIIQGIIFDLKQTQAYPPNLIAISNQNIDPQSPVTIQNNYLSYITVPFEISLESMSRKYLGTVNRWYELVTVNALQPPYLDPIGVQYSLLAPGASNNLVVSTSSTGNVAVGTKIRIGSYSQREEPRIVERIINNANSTSILFLSGAQDLSRFKPTEGAYIRVYAPSTTRDGEFVKIPSALPAPTQPNPTPTSNQLSTLSEAFIAFGVDIARDPNTYDLQFDANGNFTYASGNVAVLQAVTNAIRTNQGELPFHPGYGLNANIGSQFYGTADEAVIFSQLLSSSILSDPRFTNVQIGSISITKTSLSMKILVTIYGSDTVIPLTYSA